MFSHHSRRPSARARVAAAASLLLLTAPVLAGCAASDSLAQQARAGDEKNYIAGDGSVREYAADNRGKPVAFSSTLFGGKTVDAASFKGKVTVLNFWYAGCAPCRVEAKDLQSLYSQFKTSGAQFYGVNVRDEEPTAAAFERTFGTTYPSFEDRNGTVLLAMTQYVPPQSVPTTLVLDKQGRVSARILGTADKGTLKSLIQTAQQS
ncbi:TlpA disulfide reductase family protein [Tersicoccus sp. Bi-70]|uniref:TlpA family protein disulfide reductase n=1 Tax=Tersicoccus sp. Bi-70 TaxID=1897634 RepID=UPI0009780F2F|nr:TlpA disulfide reductase family protein [Tersicoccus sp. Bi-70]OMH34453.1 thiol-disulfide isomerase [Tersicoccus sp. Bi-70]